MILLLIGKSYSEVELSPLGCLSSSSHRATGATGGVYIDFGLVSNVVSTQTPDRNIKYKPARFKSARYGELIVNVGDTVVILLEIRIKIV